LTEKWNVEKPKMVIFHFLGRNKVSRTESIFSFFPDSAIYNIAELYEYRKNLSNFQSLIEIGIARFRFK